LILRREQFQILQKIITAFFPPLRFDEPVKLTGDHLFCLPACHDGRVGGLITIQNQHRADL
jgi:hypothetical protein